MKDMQQQVIDQLLARHDGNKTRAAEILGMSRSRSGKTTGDRPHKEENRNASSCFTCRPIRLNSIRRSVSTAIRYEDHTAAS